MVSVLYNVITAAFRSLGQTLSEVDIFSVACSNCPCQALLTCLTGPVDVAAVLVGPSLYHGQVSEGYEKSPRFHSHRCTEIDGRPGQID